MSSPLDFEIPGYDILESIGRGGMASVYRARQHTFDRNVALKILKPDLSEDDAFCQRFIMESMIVAKLSHSHIVQVYDVGEISNHYYIAMEFLSGGDLSARLNKGISVKDSIHVIKQIASALDFAHRKNIIHRDLKPDNVMFREDEAAVLTDFGIAKETSADINLTQTGLIVGTPKYMSPEQIRGSAPSPQGDIYSLGIMFFQLLCKRVPFHGPDLMATAYKHFNDPVPALPAHLAPFQTLLEQMLAKEVDDRIARGNDVVAAIEDIEKRFPSFEVPSEEETMIMQLENSEDDATVVKVSAESDTIDASTEQSNQKTTIVSASPSNKNVPLASSAETIVMRSSDETQLKSTSKAANEQKIKAVRNKQENAQKNSNKEENKEQASHQKSNSKEASKNLPQNKNLKVYSGIAASIVIATAFVVGVVTVQPEKNEAPDSIGSTENNIASANLTNNQKKHEEQVKSLLANAKKAFADAPLATHKQSAFWLYKEILRLSPDDPRAQEGLNTIANQHLKAADKAIDEREFLTAKAHLASAKNADATINISALESKLENSNTESLTLNAKQSFQVSALLEEAKYYENQGDISAPPGSNAIETYKKILAIDPNHAKAKTRLEKLEK